MNPNSAVLHQRLASKSLELPPAKEQRGAKSVVLNAALGLFATHGFGGTSVRDIAATAGVQPATMYAHYPSKQHVLAELIQIGHEEHHRRLRAALLESGSDPAQQLAAVVRAHVRMHTDYSMLAVVANAELHALAEEFVGPSLALRRQSEQLMMDVVQRGIDLGKFKVSPPWLALTAIGGMGLRIAHWYAPDSGISADELADRYADFALRIVGAEPVSSL